MKVRLIQIVMLLLCAGSTAFAGGGMDPDSEKALDAVLAGNHRSDENKARDKYRHPKETLAFFGIKKDMTVVEVSPGGGAWYMEVLAPFLAKDGVYYAAGFDPESDSEYVKKNLKKFNAKLEGNPEAYGKVKKTVFAQGKLNIAPAGSADMVLTFRNIHNWGPDEAQKAVFSAFHRALKPGGILGVVEHRAGPNQKEGSGYMSEDYVIEIAKSVGFELVGKSDINANPKDTKDHPKGVWTLPPVLATKADDGDKYVAIGESDRMTLKFVKR